LASCRHQTGIGDIGDRDQTHVSVLSVEQPAGQWLVDILKPVAADDVGVRHRRAQIGGISGPALLLGGDIEKRTGRAAELCALLVFLYGPVTLGGGAGSPGATGEREREPRPI
jgi:hypothetical protein